MTKKILWLLFALTAVQLVPIASYARPPGLTDPNIIWIDDFTPIPDHLVYVYFRCDRFEQRQNQVWASGVMDVLIRNTHVGGTVDFERTFPATLPVTQVRSTSFQPYAYPGTIPVVRMNLGGGTFSVDGYLIEFGQQDLLWFGSAAVFSAVDLAVRTKPAAHVARALNDLDYGVPVDQYLWP